MWDRELVDPAGQSHVQANDIVCLEMTAASTTQKSAVCPTALAFVEAIVYSSRNQTAALHIACANVMKNAVLKLLPDLLCMIISLR